MCKYTRNFWKFYIELWSLFTKPKGFLLPPEGLVVFIKHLFFHLQNLKRLRSKGSYRVSEIRTFFKFGIYTVWKFLFFSNWSEAKLFIQISCSILMFRWQRIKSGHLKMQRYSSICSVHSLHVKFGHFHPAFDQWEREMSTYWSFTNGVDILHRFLFPGNHKKSYFRYSVFQVFFERIRVNASSMVFFVWINQKKYVDRGKLKKS